MRRTTKSRIAIVGSGQAGANVAVGLREEGFDGEVVLLGEEPGLPFGRPPLSKTYLRGEEGLASWQVKPDEWFEANRVERRAVRVERIDSAGQRVMLRSDEEVACDLVCIATGCRPKLPAMPGVTLEGVLTLRTKEDCDRIKQFTGAGGARVVVAGMGFIGAEVAASLRQLGVGVTAVASGDGPLGSQLGAEFGRRLADIHRANGVDLVQGKVTAFRGKQRVEQVVTDSGHVVDCTCVIVGVGAEPNVDVAAGTPIVVSDGIVVDARCQTTVPSIYAAGDVARHDHPIFGPIRVEHYNNAEKQGRFVARAMLGDQAPYDYIHTLWSDQYDHKIEYVGYAKDWDNFVIRGDRDSEALMAFYLRNGKVTAAAGLDRGGDPEAEPESELAAAAQLIRRRRPVRVDSLADESIPIHEVDFAEVP